jgi:hypothetical protein
VPITQDGPSYLPTPKVSWLSSRSHPLVSIRYMALPLEQSSVTGPDASHGPAISKGALDILFFFTGVEPNRSGILSMQEPPALKICKLCSYVQTCLFLSIFLMTSSTKYGSTLPIGVTVANFIFSPNTANATLRRHLHEVHAEEYDNAVLQHRWSYKLLGEPRGASAMPATSATGSL